MDWEIVPFVGVGPVKFGMSPTEVLSILGTPVFIDSDGPDYRKEIRAKEIPSITYEDNAVVEIEAFSETKELRLGDLKIFETNGLHILRTLESLNGGVMANVGIFLFDGLGITTGQLDSNVTLDHSVTAFRRGYWDDSVKRFKPATLS